MNLKQIVKEYLLITAGCLLAALALNIFLVPYKIAPGGIAGLATIFYYSITKVIPIGTLMLLFNVPLFILGYKHIGRHFITKTLVGTFLLSLFVDTTEPFINTFINEYIVKFDPEMATPDLLLYAIAGGALMGIGIGLVFLAGASTGGTDLAASIINSKINNLSLGKSLLIIDFSVILLATIIFKSFRLGLYATVSMYITTLLIDIVLEGVSKSKAVFIISDKTLEIADVIINQLDRGVTSLRGQGMYSGNNKNILLCVMKRNEIPQIKRVIKEIDKNSFVILTDVREVIGEGFQHY